MTDRTTPVNAWTGSRKQEFIVLVLTTCAVLGVAFYAVWDTPPFVDEFVHMEQILALANGIYLIHPVATTIPGYHAVIAVLARIVGGQSPDMLRLYSTLLSFLSVMVFYLAAKQRKNTSGLLPVVQFMMLPILFPYSVLVYTDLFALATVVFCYYLHVKKNCCLPDGSV